VIARIIEFSARNPFLVLLLIVVIIGGGSWAIYNTPLDAIPCYTCRSRCPGRPSRP
jgi:Cu(I)/Ag(I) efflux system membrane protein CusA/SilA